MCLLRHGAAIRVATDTTLFVVLRLRPLLAGEKKRKTKLAVSDSMRRRLSGEEQNFSLDAEPKTPLRDAPFSGAADGAHARPAESARLHLSPPPPDGSATCCPLVFLGVFPHLAVSCPS